jgi:dynein heavy chain
MLDDINNLLNSGSVPNLFPVEERLQIQERLRALAKRAGRQDLHDSGTVEEFEEYFTERVREHLHVVLAMSPVGSALRDRIRNFPSLVNCCTIDWFLRWPDEALEAVCEVVLEDAGLVEGQGHQVATACRVLHQSAEQLSARLGRQRRPLYVTPTSYLELLLTYKQLLGTEREKTLRLRASYERGVQKLLFTAEEVEKMREELNEKQPRLEQMTVETDLLMQQIEQESSQVVAPKQAQVQVEEAIANQQAREAEAIKADCDSDLAKALPLLAKAQDALNTIKSSHIGEIKVLGNPPGPVKRVLHAVCVMCQRKAERTPKKENPKLTEDNWWYTAQKFMAEKNFLQGLLDFDKDSIPEAVMRKIRDQFLPDPDFKPARVEKASVAAKGLCQWIRALD